MTSFVNGNKGDVPSGCPIPADGSHCPCDSPSRPDPPRKGGGLGVLLEENAGEPLDPS